MSALGAGQPRQGVDSVETAHQKAFLKKSKFSTKPQLIINLQT